MWVGEEVDPTGEPLGLPIDTLQYAASYSDLLIIFGSDATLLNQHYNTSGYYEGRSKDLFDELRYIASNPDLINVFGVDGNAATQHYVTHGYFEERSKSSFDPAQYLASHDDLLNAFRNDYGVQRLNITSLMDILKDV
ncbi:hypothetical protein [[Leptolyngbya] sp. PCC 7376]|uniref:hypothetical protein n=1 Tax=[Leptolyngbya] sp. PCC 7376 TaxID=111781 RepID=UPI00059F025A|nr:hypothetical protein [[Leptolyngbya] sp. PCC 7376]